MKWALLVIGLANAGALALLGQRLLAFIAPRLDKRLSLSEREVALQERQHELRARTASPPSIPPDLLRRITAWTDPSAQESERAVILSLYDELRDKDDPWAAVRSHLPPAPDGEISSPLLS